MFFDIATDESDGENLQLDWAGESFDEVSVEKMLDMVIAEEQETTYYMYL